jgi:signal transduction histidine kinase/class 3 adenylate cyclase/CheY-like chemotaxis protein
MALKNRFILLAGIFLSQTVLIAQSSSLDSLKRIIKDHSQPLENRLEAVRQITPIYAQTKPDSLLAYSLLEYDLAEQLGDKEKMTFALHNRGTAYNSLGQADSTKMVFDEQLRLSQEIDYKPGIALALADMGHFYKSQGDFKRAIEYFSQSLGLYEELDEQKNISYAHNWLGVSYEQTGNYQQALEHYNQQLEIQKELGMESDIGIAYMGIGTLHARQGNYTQALNSFNRCLEIGRKLEFDQLVIVGLVNIGNIYMSQEDYEKAREFQLEMLSLAEKLKIKRIIIGALENIGLGYKNEGNIEEALHYLQRAAEMYKEVGNQLGYANTLRSLGDLYEQQNNQSKAIAHFQESLDIQEKLENKAGMARTMTELASIYLDQGNIRLSINFGKRALKIAQETGEIHDIKSASSGLSEAYRANRQYREALETYYLFITTRDSIQSEKNQKATLNFEYEQKALQDSLAFVQQQAATELAYQKELTQRNYILFGGIGLTLLVAGGFWLWQQRQTRERKLQAERERNERLEQIDRLKDQFLANTSHELRTPLNGIIGLSEGLFEREKDEENRQNLGMIVASGKRLASLVNDLLDFSRLRNADLHLRQKPTHLRSLVDIVLQVSFPLTQGKKLSLQNEIPTDLPAVFADEDRLTQILHNLIGNAIKFTEAGKIIVSAVEKADMIRISISDTGIGIPKEQQELIFAAFEQGDGSISREYSGTGLGLSITRQLIHQHGGRIWVESEVGTGSVFHFTLPISKEEVVPASLPQLTPLMQESVTSAAESKTKVTPIFSGDKIRLLIVDDEPINHRVLRNHLRDERFVIESAMNGQEALEKLSSTEKPFDLILLDVMMPRMSGYEVAKKIRRTHLPSELPIIMITAKNQVTDLVQGLETGANDYLAKPFSKDEFLARLNTHLNLGQINRASGRFVPNEFIQTLGRKNISEAKLGDHIDQELTVFFSDIRSYTSLAEKMTPEENFRFVNSYAQRMGPLIHKNHGFVNQYLGDGIMAIFQQNPADALQAAIDMQLELQDYNQLRIKRGHDPLRVGMGMHLGPLIMGIIGDQKRTDTAVIADTVNTAARVEGLTKYYGANILISETGYDLLPSELRKTCRYVGPVQVKGRAKPLGIYECWAGDSPGLIDKKRKSQEDFQAALNAFLKGDMDLVINKCKPLAEEGDMAANRFMNQASYYLANGLPENWSGVEVMNEK